MHANGLDFKQLTSRANARKPLTGELNARGNECRLESRALNSAVIPIKVKSFSLIKEAHPSPRDDL
jgi:hypothetical protein